MSDPQLLPKAREGLLTTDHSKRGNRFVSILDGKTQRVTLLEPWEHAVLVLCDGTRKPVEIVELLESGIAGEVITQRTLARCLKYFEQQELIEPLGLRSQTTAMPAAGPRTVAGLQQAFREWHKDPVRTGQILTGMPIEPPIYDPTGSVRPGLGPTVALTPDRSTAVGTKLVIGEGEEPGGLVSVFAGPKGGAIKAPPSRAAEPRTEIGSLTGQEHEAHDEKVSYNVHELLAAVDQDFESLSDPGESIETRPQKRAPPPIGKPIGGVAEIPLAREGKTHANKIEVPDAVLIGASSHVKSRIERSHVSAMVNPEIALNPTMVGRAPETGSGPPEIISGSRDAKTSPGERVRATIGPAPKDPSGPIQPAADPLSEPTQQMELATDSGYAAQPISTSARVDDDTTSQTQAHLSGLAREVFERLRKAGLLARSYGDESLDGGAGVSAEDAVTKKRRKNPERAAAFQQALERLTAGDLQVALAHFTKLQAQMPESTRVQAFVDAIKAASGEGNSDDDHVLDNFEGLLEDALAYGRCPRCLSMMAPDSRRCAGCDFAL